jgi:predicted phosphodiesterase/2-polyprenyl-3-methyl-5-hydroxy-6-metoxy-1,4-benzoquinol methylase
MRVAILSDIHGNRLALDAVLADLEHEQIDQMVCLGDAIQGGPQPVEVVDKLRELACPVVMGNADDWLLTGIETDADRITEERRIQLNAVRDWMLTKLSEDDLAYIRSFQPTIRLALSDTLSLLCYHGSPKSYDDIILPQTPEDEVRGYLNPDQQTIYTGGHTHIQFIRHFGKIFHFNPGSIGFAYRHDQPDGEFRADAWAEYAILSLNDGKLSLEFRRVDYDAEQLIEIYRASGRPYADVAIAQYDGTLRDEQLAYYRARAAEYDTSVRGIGGTGILNAQDTDATANDEWRQIVTALNAVPPVESVLELACGTGIWTEELAKISRSITALDGAQEMIEVNRAKLAGENVTYQCVDLFSWQPDQQYDFVFFAFWISHVPPNHLKTFLSKVAQATKIGGSVFIVDEPQGGVQVSGANREGIYQQRSVQDGRTFQIVKVYYDPNELTRELDKLGFQVETSTIGSAFFHLYARRIK